MPRRRSTRRRRGWPACSRKSASTRTGCATSPSTAATSSSWGSPKGRRSVGSSRPARRGRGGSDAEHPRAAARAREVAVRLLEWDAGPEYAVAFSTRQGGVSEGPFESLNLGKLTLDEAENVEENRRRLCAAIGVEPEPACVQPAAALGARASCAEWSAGRAGRRSVERRARCADAGVHRGLRPGGDRAGGATGACGALHVGWRGLLAGIVAEGVGALGAAARAAVGPAIGPCCYEVGDEVAAPFRERFGSDVLAEGTSTSGPRPSGRSGRRGSRRSSASISARRATRSSSSRIAGTTA